MNTSLQNKNQDYSQNIIGLDAEIFHWIVCKIEKYKTETTLIKNCTTISQTSENKSIT